MSEPVIKTIENVDKLFSEIIVNGESHVSQRFNATQQSNTTPVRTQIQGEDVHAVELNDVLHNFSDPDVVTDVQNLQQGLADEILTRQNADQALDSAVVSLTGSVDILQGKVSTIESEIPSQASSSNQLADKNFVNSSVSTNTANFLGTYTSLADIQAIQNPTNNDYAFLQTTDSVGNNIFDRYKYNANQDEWLFEYELNSSSFTAEQWATINSGLTQASVTSQINTAVDGEASARSTAITNAINALDVTEKGGTGKYIKAIKETNGKISATEGTVDSTPSSGSDNLITSGAVYTGLDGKVDKSGAVTGVKGNSETDYRAGNVNITKGNIGLGNVVNTSDGTAPVSGGTTKFTTGGAYTEFMKKANTIEGITAVTSLEYTYNQDVFIVDFIAKIITKYPRYSANTMVKFSWSSANAVNLVFVASPTTTSTRINTSGLIIIGNLVTISSSSAWVDMNLLLIDVNNTMYHCRITKGEANATISVSLVQAITGVSGVKGNSESSYRTGNVNITKSNIGLGNVVDTGDSATPVSGGTTKFTTGGAYTELNKKVSNSDSCAYKYYGSMNGTTKYATITFNDTYGAIIVTTGYSSSIVFDANKGTPMCISSSAYGVTGYAWSSNGKTLYLKFSGYRPIAVLIPSIKRTEVGTVGDTGIKVNFSDVTTTAPSGVTFSTTFNQVDTVSDRDTAISTAETNAKNLANATGTLAVSHGGTGKTTVEEASASFGAIAYCETIASQVTKTATCYGYKLIIGQAVKLYIATTNGVSSPTLNINETGAKSIFVDGVAGSATNLTAGWYVCLYDGNCYQLFSLSTSVLPSSGCAVCHTAGATAGKVASMPNFKLQSGTTFLITFVNANTKNTALTLNINGTGAKTIYINGTVSSADNYTLPAGTYVCRYNGTNYYIDTSYAVPNARSASSATSAGKWTTARNFTISDADSSHSGTAVSVNGESAVTIKLPSIIKATLSGTANNANSLGGVSVLVPPVGVESYDYTTPHWSYVEKAKLTTTGGYVIYNNGLKIQWGIHTNTGGDVTQTVNFNTSTGVSFTQPPIVTASFRRGDSQDVFWYALNINNVTVTSFKLGSHSSFNDTLKFFWIAMGY